MVVQLDGDVLVVHLLKQTPIVRHRSVGRVGLTALLRWQGDTLSASRILSRRILSRRILSRRVLSRRGLSRRGLDRGGLPPKFRRRRSPTPPPPHNHPHAP